MGLLVSLKDQSEPPLDNALEWSITEATAEDGLVEELVGTGRILESLGNWWWY